MAAGHPFLEWPGPLAFAHRGGAGESPENTAAAFQRVIDLGYTFIETDTRTTADGVVVIFHDEDLRRAGGRPERVADLTWEELATVRVNGREPIPRLDELLATWPATRFNIDCKDDRTVTPLADTLRHADALDRVCVGSFSQWRLFRLRRQLGPALCTSAGPLETAALRVLGFPLGGSHAAQIPVRKGPIPLAEARFVNAAHRRGMQVHVWTIDDAAEMNRLLDLGVDGIVTDEPTVLRDVLTARGAWFERF